MTENRISPHRSSETKNAETIRAASAVLRDPRKRSALLDADYIRTPKASSPIPKRSPNCARLAIQLSIDPTVRTIKYIESLPALGHRVKVQMLVAEREDGRRFAYDLIDERPPHDIDLEGLFLIALEENSIELVEIDRMQVNQQPRASNCLRIWHNRNYSVADSARTAIEEALTKHGPLPIRKLGETAGIPSPFRAVCALTWQGVLALDISQQLDRDALVARRSDILDQSVGLGPHATT